MDQWDARSLLFWNTKGAILSFSMVVYSNDSIVLLPSVEESMADRSNFSRALYIPYAINTTLGVAFSVVAFLSFQFNTDEVIINNLPAGPIRITVSMLFLSSCLLSYALTGYPIIEYLLQTAPIQNISAKISDVLISAAVRITLVLVTVLLAAVLPHFALLASLTSSLLLSLGVFIFPSSVHLKLKYHELKSHQVLLDLFVIGIGVILCVFGVFVSAELSSRHTLSATKTQQQFCDPYISTVKNYSAQPRRKISWNEQDSTFSGLLEQSHERNIHNIANCSKQVKIKVQT